MALNLAVRDIDILKTDGGLRFVQSEDGVGTKKATVSTKFSVVLEKNEVSSGLILTKKVVLVRKEWFGGGDEGENGVEMAGGNDFFKDRKASFCLGQLIETDGDLLRIREVKTRLGFRVDGE